MPRISKAYRALHAVQVIVQTRGRLNEKGSGHTQKVQPLGEGALEEIFDGLDGNLGIVKIQIGMVIFRINGFAHKNPSFVFFSKAKRQQTCILCRFEPLQYMLAYQEKGVNWKFQKMRAVFGKGSAIIKILSFAWENEKMKKKHSLKLVIVSLAFLCWLIPILLMVAVMGYYVLSKQDDEQLERLAEQMAASSRICQERLDGAIANSRRISYDKTVQQKYEQYQRGELSYAALYSEVQYYLSVEYSRKKEAAFALIMMNGKEKDESFIVSNAVQYMQEHFREKITLPEVAEKIYVSQWHLSKLLNRYMGKNFSEVLNSIRIEKAKELMKDPSLRLADIAEMVGFLDVAHFSRVFKKLTGVSAGEYRNYL